MSEPSEAVLAVIWSWGVSWSEELEVTREGFLHMGQVVHTGSPGVRQESNHGSMLDSEGEKIRCLAPILAPRKLS